MESIAVPVSEVTPIIPDGCALINVMKARKSAADGRRPGGGFLLKIGQVTVQGSSREDTTSSGRLALPHRGPAEGTHADRQAIVFGEKRRPISDIQLRK